jgi:hypothetical protein
MSGGVQSPLLDRKHLSPKASVLKEINLPLDLDLAISLLLQQSRGRRVFFTKSISDFEVVSLFGFDLASLRLLQLRRRDFGIVLVRASRVLLNLLVGFLF